MNLDLELVNKLKEQKILPIINSVNFKEDLLKLTSLLDTNKKIKIIEITLRESHSLENAIKLKKRFPNLIIGLGSIINKKQYEEVKNYNFSFFVSPGTIYEMINSKIENYIPGAETISEFNYLDNNEINIVKFKKTSFSLSGIATKSISMPKMQETPTIDILRCIQGKAANMHNCNLTKRSQMDIKIEINKRLGTPLFIPLMALVCCFLLGSRKDKKIYSFNKYIYSFIGIIILTLSEILVRYSGISWNHTSIYYLIPIGMITLFYFTLIRKFKYENLN